MNMGQLVEQGTGEVFLLGFEPVSIGRHEDNTIILPDAQISRHHAEIVMQGGRWLLADLGSANGSYVNGQRIAGPHVLNHGDLIRLGKTQFQVEVAEALAAQDTLVERIPAQAAVPAPAVGRRLAVSPVWVALAAGTVILIGVAVIWAIMRGTGDTSLTASATPTSAVAVEPTRVESASPTARVKPTTTAIPTIPPPTPLPTALPPIAVPPPATDTAAPAPAIGYFRAGQDTLEQGKCTRLEWGDVENANRITLSDVGRVGPAGTIDVCLDATKTYTLQASGAGGTVKQSVEITVQVPAGPSIEYFRAVPSIISPGKCAQLEWGKVENSTSATIEPGIGGVGTPGTLEVCPTSTTTYVLTAENPEGARAAQTTILVSTGTESRPVIAFFTANPVSIEAGKCTTLSWGRVDYATSVTIDHNIGGVATPGSKEVCLGTTTTFLMTAVGAGGTTEYDLTVNVSPGPLADLPDLVVESILFEPNPCFRTQKCKVRITVRNDGPVAAGHFEVRWTPVGEGQVPVEWDVDSLDAGQTRELVYPWRPSQAVANWRTVATVDLNNKVNEIEEGEGNSLEQFITVLEPK